MVILRESESTVSNEAEIIAQEEAYMSYINEHVTFVQQSYYELFVNKEIHIDSISDEELRNAIMEIEEAIKVHDASKFSDDEFNAYRAKYNPIDMSLGAIIHMICDWEAMSKKFKTNTLEWYETQADEEKACMTEHSRIILEELLKAVFE